MNCYPRNGYLRDIDFMHHIISPQSVPIFATSHLVGCIEYLWNSLEDKVDKSSVTETISVSLMGTLNSVYLIYSSDNLLLDIITFCP